MDKRMRFLEMEVVRLNNKLASRDEYVSFLENELKSIEIEYAEELALKDEFIADQAETISNLRKEKEDALADAVDARGELDDARAVILSLQGQIIESNSDKKQLEKDNEDKQKLAELAAKAKMDFKDIVNLLQNRIFNTNSDRTRYLNGAIDLNDPLIGEMGFEAIINEVLRQTDGIIEQEGGNADKDNKERPKYQKRGKTKKSQVGKSKKHHVFTKEILQKLGMDTSNLPEGSKLIHRKDKSSGEDVWTVVLLHYQGPKTLRTEQEIGRYNVPKNDPMCSKHPQSIIEGNPVMPSLASFYLNSKFGYSLSENRIIEMLTESGADIPQSTLNKWMHEIMTLMRERLQSRMLDDEKGFKAFLTDGAIELSDNVAERMFRHIAMGRRNWLHIGSHTAAQNIAFMYSLYESCRLNNINFGKYLNDILTRMMKGDTNYMAMLPCNYVAQEHEDELRVKECA